MPDRESGAKPFHDDTNECMDDLPPAYDALSIHQTTSHHLPSLSALPGHVVRPSGALPRLRSADLEPPVDKSLPPLPSSPSSPRVVRPASPQRLRPRKNTSWLSLLPFSSSFSAKRARQSVLSIVSDLAVPPSRINTKEQKSVEETFAFLVETCAEHNLSLSSILQEVSVADHTPMYWAVVSYRQELLLALLVHSRPLTIQTISDIRRACLMSSNQLLFHALRVCRPPFHVTDGIQVPSLRAASNNLLLGNRPTDEIFIHKSSEQGFTISFNIPLWQRRLKVIGQVSIEFIASSRMWSLTFFSTDPQSKATKPGKTKQERNTCHVMVSLLESSPPTFFDARLVVDAPTTVSISESIPPRLRGAQSTSFTLSRDGRPGAARRSSVYDYSHDGTSSRTARHSPHSPPPSHPARGLLGASSSQSRLPPISIRLGCGSHKLSRQVKSGESLDSLKLATTPDTWSDHGVGYTNAAISPLGAGSRLLYDHSQYLCPDGTLSGRLDARFIKSELSKGCIIC